VNVPEVPADPGVLLESHGGTERRVAHDHAVDIALFDKSSNAA
jgi:hypothetical protein